MFDITRVLLNPVVQVFALPDSDAVFFWFVSIERGQRRRVGATFIDSDHLGFATITNGFAKEAQRGRGASRLVVSRKSTV